MTFDERTEVVPMHMLVFFGIVASSVEVGAFDNNGMMLFQNFWMLLKDLVRRVPQKAQEGCANCFFDFVHTSAAGTHILHELLHFGFRETRKFLSQSFRLLGNRKANTINPMIAFDNLDGEVDRSLGNCKRAAWSNRYQLIGHLMVVARITITLSTFCHLLVTLQILVDQWSCLARKINKWLLGIIIFLDGRESNLSEI